MAVQKPVAEQSYSCQRDGDCPVFFVYSDGSGACAGESAGKCSALARVSGHGAQRPMAVSVYGGPAAGQGDRSFAHDGAGGASWLLAW